VNGLHRLGLGHPDDGVLVRIGLCVPVDAVVGGVQLSPGEPLPERRVAGIQNRVERLVPGQQVCVFGKAAGEILLGEPVIDGRVGCVGLRDERRRRLDVLLFAPVNCDLGLGNLLLSASVICSSSSREMKPAQWMGNTFDRESSRSM
jgi:hypothetical protein